MRMHACPVRMGKGQIDPQSMPTHKTVSIGWLVYAMDASGVAGNKAESLPDRAVIHACVCVAYDSPCDYIDW